MAGLNGPGPVLVTGATGFVGGHLVRSLLADRQPVVALVRDIGRVEPSAGLTVVSVPATDLELRSVVAEHRPKACVHLATHFVAGREVDDVAALVDANVTYGLRVAEACLAGGGVPFVDTGTVWQHAGGAAYRPVNLYAATKEAFHALLVDLAQRDLPVATIELTDTYGPGDRRAKLVPTLVEAARSGEVLPMGQGQGQVDLVHVDDVVAGFRSLLDRLTDGQEPLRPARDASTVHTLSSGTPCTVRDVVALVDAALGRPLPVEWGARPDRPTDRPAPTPRHPPLPGWSPTIPLAEGLGRLFAPLASSHQQ